MTDKALLIAALRQCADRLEQAGVVVGLGSGTDSDLTAEAVREYRLLADLCEGKPDAEADLYAACKAFGELFPDSTGHYPMTKEKFKAELASAILMVRAALALADGTK